MTKYAAMCANTMATMDAITIEISSICFATIFCKNKTNRNAEPYASA